MEKVKWLSGKVEKYLENEFWFSRLGFAEGKVSIKFSTRKKSFL
jgi:hypothetical protein